MDPKRILYSDEYLLGVHKLSGELVVKGMGEVVKLPLLDFLKKDYPVLQTLHRLDFETSGVVLFARNKKVAAQVKESKFSGWKKVYRTLVVGRPNLSGVIRIALPVRNPNHQIPITNQIPNSKIQNDLVPAVTTYKVLKFLGDVSYIECEIETGRHHQIRRHFSGIGHPLVLDDLYGDRKFNQRFARALGYRRFFLHAYALDFPHPVTKEHIHIEAPLPRVFEEVLSRI